MICHLLNAGNGLRVLGYLCDEYSLRTRELFLEERRARVGAQAGDWSDLEHLEHVENFSNDKEGLRELQLFEDIEAVLSCPLGEELFEGRV